MVDVDVDLDLDLDLDLDSDLDAAVAVVVVVGEKKNDRLWLLVHLGRWTLLGLLDGRILPAAHYPPAPQYLLENSRSGTRACVLFCFVLLRVLAHLPHGGGAASS